MTAADPITDRDTGDENDVRACGAETVSGYPCSGQKVACKLPAGHPHHHRADLGSGYEWNWPIKESVS